MAAGAVNDFSLLVHEFSSSRGVPTSDPVFTRRWSYGDVENNGVYYHPQLTHYAHQAFEEFFYNQTGIHYTDLPRQTPASEKIRQAHSPPIVRMTFPVGWLHQWMLKPMHAGEEFKIWIDTVAVATNRIGVRAWIYNETNELAAVVIWLRWAKTLDGLETTVPIPAWFPVAALP
ncbi:MAG TPA: hypothetical protein VF173_36170 [Thermoanaerobaculia bacterium]|nr:hypothetical protein [Thermoanaerobaculia bacterium]